MEPLTICTVSYYSTQYLALNRELTSRFNPASAIHWLVVDNTPPEDRLPSADAIPGPAFDASLPNPASYHHAAALNLAIQQVKTRFVLVLDPDFYIIRPQWVADVLQHMQAQDLALLGVPWHPKRWIKPRYFAAVHCLFLDVTQLDQIDFRPDFTQQSTTQETSKSTVKRRIPAPLLNLRKLLILTRKNWQRRQGIGRSRDTGIRLLERYQGVVPHEIITPVYRLPDDYRIQPDHLRPISLLLDRLVPDSRSYRPKKQGSYSADGFGEMGYPDVTQFGWEEFVWHGQPFGFHVRGQRQEKPSPEQELAQIQAVLDTLN